MEKTPVARSDELIELESLVSSLEGLKAAVGSGIQIRAVLDSSIIVKDLYFTVRGRRREGSRTSLQEVIDAGTLVPFGPELLLTEVEARLPEIAEETGKSV